MQQEKTQLRTFYKTLEGKGALPLEADDPHYVPIHGAHPAKDPIRLLWQRIDLAESESVNLLTGFRGNGKSTELRRLKKMLEEESGCVVFLVNMLDYLLMTKPVELSDFTLSLMAGLSHQAGEAKELGLLPTTNSYWDKLSGFLQSEVKIDKIALKGGGAELALQLKTEPNFKELVQQHLRGHLTRLLKDAQVFVDELVRQIRTNSGDPDKKVVLLVDSAEQIRGQGEDAQKVQNSVAELFSGQASNLAFPKLHVVYTVPPFLTALIQNLGRCLGGHPIVQWPNIHVRSKIDGSPDPYGIEVMKDIVGRRYPEWQRFFDPKDLARLAHFSGGDLRDFFRLIKECLIATMIGLRPDQPVDQETLERAVQLLRNDMLPLADEDARRLAKIHDSKREELGSVDELPHLVRYLDTNLIMNYLNGEPWYDIHPALVEELRKRGFVKAAEPEKA